MSKMLNRVKKHPIWVAASVLLGIMVALPQISWANNAFKSVWAEHSADIIFGLIILTFLVVAALLVQMGTLMARMGAHEEKDNEVQRRIGDMEKEVRENSSLLIRIANHLKIPIKEE